MVPWRFCAGFHSHVDLLSTVFSHARGRQPHSMQSLATIFLGIPVSVGRGFHVRSQVEFCVWARAGFLRSHGVVDNWRIPRVDGRLVLSSPLDCFLVLQTARNRGLGRNAMIWKEFLQDFKSKRVNLAYQMISSCYSSTTLWHQTVTIQKLARV